MFFHVTGASGVGKTSVRKLIEAEIAGRVEVCELGTLGLTPEWSLRWRHQAVEHVVNHRHRPEVIIKQGWEGMRWESWNSEEVKIVPWKSHIIDTSELKPSEVAREVLSWIKLRIGG